MEFPTVEWTNEELITGLRHIAHTMERNGHSYYQHVAEEAIKALEQTDKMFFISEILVRESKLEITPEKALNQIRDILMGYTFWDKESEGAE